MLSMCCTNPRPEVLSICCTNPQPEVCRWSVYDARLNTVTIGRDALFTRNISGVQRINELSYRLLDIERRYESLFLCLIVIPPGIKTVASPRATEEPLVVHPTPSWQGNLGGELHPVCTCRVVRA